MNAIRENDRVRHYLHQVCEQIKAVEVHPDIRAELRTHLEEVTEKKVASDMPFDQAIDVALFELGDPIRLGGGLHKSHKPKMEWSLLFLMVFFIALALIAMFSIEASLGVMYGSLMKKELYTGLGVFCMAGLYFFDYRKLVSYSWALFILTLLGMVIAVMSGSTKNGVTSGFQFSFIYINIAEACPYILVIAVAGILQNKNWRNTSIGLKWGGFLVLPCFIIMQSHSISSILVYCAGYMAILIASKAKWNEFLIIFAGFTVLMYIYISNSAYAMDRFRAYLNPFGSPRDSGYMTINSIKAIQSAGWWGQGYGAAIPTLPGIYAEMIFSYMVYSLGWIMGIVILTGCVLMVSRLLCTARKVKEEFGRMLILGLTGVLTIKFIWGIAMSIGLLPIVSMQLPFIGNGGNQFLLQCCSMGLIASVYKRKDMIPLTAKKATRQG
jgi:cell division protein FtsW (lipid II flippase)